MSNISFFGDDSGLQATAHPRPPLSGRRRFRRCDELTAADKLKAVLAGILIGLMVAAPVFALVAATTGKAPDIFHEVSPWSFGGRK
ncbi:hypothetical protein [Breoghania sp.]|uniref:hypothetical protein n=1 Tax=Breoghania sp. TaxID=2065378 RepID=UPI002AA66FA2|nr:hypothetical protein [Breoghania sp.]